MTKPQAIDKINIRKEQIHEEIRKAKENNDIEVVMDLTTRLEEIQNIINLFR